MRRPCARQDFTVAPQPEVADLGARMRSALAAELETAEQVSPEEHGGPSSFCLDGGTPRVEVQALLLTHNCGVPKVLPAEAYAAIAQVVLQRQPPAGALF